MFAKRPHKSALIDGGESGVALISALAMLLFFSMLGTAYIGYMSIGNDQAMYETRIVRARHLAEAGVTAAAAEIRKAIEAGVAPESTYTYSFPVYVRYRSGDEIVEESFPQEVVVRVEDESRLININHAPREVLEAVGMDRATVRSLKASLPQSKEDVANGKRWLASINELRSRGFLAAREFAALDRSLFTVYSVADPYNPARYINLNSATPEVLSAVLNISVEEAQTLSETRPFASWQEFLEKSGREPNSFNIRPSLQDPRAMPVELDLSSRCYRLYSRATLKPGRGSGGRSLVREIETVAMYDEEGVHRFRLWSETPTELLELEVDEDVPDGGDESLEPAETDDEAAPDGNEPAANDNETNEAPGA